MSKYIDADKLIAEIDSRIERIQEDEKDGYPDTTSSDATLESFRRFITSLQQEQPEVDLENYISNKLRELGADLINHKPYSFNRGLNVGETNAYHDILDRLNARKEE